MVYLNSEQKVNELLQEIFRAIQFLYYDITWKIVRYTRNYGKKKFIIAIDSLKGAILLSEMN